MSAQPLTVNQILQHLRKVELIPENVTSNNIVPLHSGEIKVNNNMIISHTIQLKDFEKRIGRDPEIQFESVLRKNNDFLYTTTLPELMNRYHQFSLRFYFRDDYRIIIDEHSYIEGVRYFSGLDDFWDQIIYLQNELPEIFRQGDSQISFVFKEGRITTLRFKYYFQDLITYPFVTNKVKEHNEVEFMKMVTAAQRQMFGEIFVTEKDQFGQIVKWYADKNVKM
ncbi:hypothetical protein ACFYU8_18455 [Brevibacillus sp. NPDC003359]|uniref:hypothetical protein n=1 Tax=unclassified Brevibacillus TaxID=2684853 RepID=UPI0036BF88B0